MVDFENDSSDGSNHGLSYSLSYDSTYSVDDLRNIIETLRAPGGCPWDIQQTHLSIKGNLLEEASEAAEAIEEGDAGHLCEELGDVLMQVVFHADISEKAGGFTFDDITDMVCRKLIRRHPHVFGDVKVGSVDEVLANWEDIKREEKAQASAYRELEK